MARKYFFNEDFFEIIDNENKAYWLGFIYADGYVSDKSLVIELHKDDESHIVKFLEDIGHPDRPKITARGYARMSVYSKKMISDLNRCGCYTRKSLTLEFPNDDIIPEHLLSHFMRGYFDGDGCFSISEGYRKRSDRDLNKRYKYIAYCFKVVGTEKFLAKYQEKLPVTANKLIFSKNSKNNFQLKYGGKNKVKIVLDWLYKNSNIVLDRKYQNYLNFINKNINNNNP